MELEESVLTREELERELARLTEERCELFARLAELESERTEQTVELLTMAAHELRTPLQTMMLATDLMLARLRRGCDEPTREWLLARLETQQDTLVQLDALTTSWLSTPALRAGNDVTVHAPVDLGALVGAVVARHARRLAWARCEVECSLDRVVGLWDASKLDAVLSNLLSNAIKYAAGKPVRISVHGDQSGAVIEVTDHGIGIDPADQSRIFDRFGRASAPSRVPGFGLGLWMARALVRSLGGVIEVQSAPGVGSTFTVRLPHMEPVVGLGGVPS